MILAGTLLGMGVVLGTYSLILAQSARSRAIYVRPPELPQAAPMAAAEDPPSTAPRAAYRIDLSTTQNRERALETIENVLFEAAPGCAVGSSPPTLDLIVRRGVSGRLESVAVTDALAPEARRCLTGALEAIVVAPSARAEEPWSVTVPLRR